MKFFNLTLKYAVIFGLFFAFTAIPAISQTSPGDTDQKTKTETEKENGQDDTLGWNTQDYKPYIKSMKDLEKLSDEYSRSRLKMAKDEFSKGIDILDDMVVDIDNYKSENSKKTYIEEKWYWQEVDRKNSQERYINRLKVEAKTKSVTYFTKAIKTLDEIKSPDLISNPEYIEVKAALFRKYVSTQYDLGNLKPCIPILERYIQLNEKTMVDVTAYNYLADCYAFMEKILDNNRASSEEDVAYYKNKKNQTMLKAVELKYKDKGGRDSLEYKELQKIVQRDERKSTVINVNK